MEVKNKHLLPQLQATNESLKLAGISNISLENLSLEMLGIAMTAIAIKKEQLDKALNQVVKLREQYIIELEYWRDKSK